MERLLEQQLSTGSDIKNPDSVTYSPNFKKPTQKVILREKIEKMPIGKLKSKSTTPNKLGNRQTVMGTSGKREPASMYQKRKGLTDNQMYRTFPGLDPNKAKQWVTNKNAGLVTR